MDWITTAIGFVTGNWTRILVYAVIAASIGLTIEMHGYYRGKQKLFEYQAKQAKEALRIGTARERVTTQIVTQYVKVAGETKLVTNTVEKEVVRYADANPGSCLDFGWGRLHDAAAGNRLPDPTPGAPDPVRAPPAAPAGGRPRVAEGIGGALDGHLQLRAASSLRRPGG